MYTNVYVVDQTSRPIARRIPDDCDIGECLCICRQDTYFDTTDPVLFAEERNEHIRADSDDPGTGKHFKQSSCNDPLTPTYRHHDDRPSRRY